MGAGRAGSRRRALAALAAFGAALALPAPAAGTGTPVTAFAAASLKESLDDVAAAWRARGGAPLRIAYGATSALARQVAAGAPAQVFASADRDWVRWLDARGLVQRPYAPLLTNTLVLAAPAASPVRVRLAPGVDLAGALDGGRLAIADPRGVPAGKYARAALEALGAWDGVRAHLAPAANVRAALAMVARGEAPLGIVYGTDAIAEPKVRVVDAFPAASHPPIEYFLVALRDASGPARAFVAFAASPGARAIWARHGFGAP